ncbi:hypothetical protein ACVWWK_002052 [Bradyrhizobium sp. LB9.1b]
MMKSPGFHRSALAVDRSVGALAFEHEAQRRLAVPMRGRDVAGHHHLHAGIERRRDFRLPAQAGVLQHQHTPLGFFCGDQLAGFGHVVADDVELPQMRPAGALRLRRDQIAHHRPQRGEILAVDLFVERLAFRRLGHGFHGAAPVRFVD